MENTACLAAAANNDAPGSGSGQESQPTERELLLALVSSSKQLANQLVSLTAAITDQNAILMDVLSSQFPEEEAAQTGQYLNGKKVG